MLDKADRVNLRNTSRECAALYYNERGLGKYFQVDFLEAEMCYSAATGLNPNLAAAFHNRGIVRYRMGRMAVAMRDFRESIAKSGKNRVLREASETFLEECRQCMQTHLS
eukprot:g441.t1